MLKSLAHPFGHSDRLPSVLS